MARMAVWRRSAFGARRRPASVVGVGMCGVPTPWRRRRHSVSRAMLARVAPSRAPRGGGGGGVGGGDGSARARARGARRGAPCARAAANARAQPRQPREEAAGGALRASESDARDGDARAAHASVMAPIDDALSKRFIALDPAGYFVIRARGDAIEARHYKNIIGEDGLARDPETNEVIPCDGSYKPVVNAEFTGRTAKEISVKIFERDGRDANDGVCTMMSHANYLGREFQRAEWCIRQGIEYVQD